MASVSEVEDPEEEVPGGSPAAGACLLTVLGAGALWTAFAHSPDVAALVVWVVGWTKLICVARTPIPAPPAPLEASPDEKPQVRTVRDTSHPNRWLVLRTSRWLEEDIDKTGMKP